MIWSYIEEKTLEKKGKDKKQEEEETAVECYHATALYDCVIVPSER